MTRKPKSLRRLKELPRVSICTPTFNRRPFIAPLIQMVAGQDYPKESLEWIVLDDGTDPVGDLFEGVEGVRYIRSEERLPLGKKRNMLNSEATGAIIVYMDDDDYYPSSRVTHAVEMLMSHPSALCAGASEIHTFFPDTGEMYQFGPYGPKHATAGTFAFRKRLLEQTSYEDSAAAAEEEVFLKQYTVPFVQLEPKKTIMVVSHRHHSFNRREVVEEGGPSVKKSSRLISDFIKEDSLVSFYTEELDGLLESYSDGLPEHKPDVLQQLEKVREKKKKLQAAEQRTEEEKLRDEKTNVRITLADGNTHILSNGEVEFLLMRNQQEVKSLKDENPALKAELAEKDEHDNDKPSVSLDIDE